MRLVPWAALLATSAWLAALGACGAFAGARVEPVVLTYLGDTVLTRGTNNAAVIAVTVNGAPLPHPRLVLSSSDTTIVAVIAGGDSLAARANGRATLTVRVQSSILTDSMPTLSQPLRVKT
jgi:sulfur carrier protein ThiS